MDSASLEVAGASREACELSGGSAAPPPAASSSAEVSAHLREEEPPPGVGGDAALCGPSASAGVPVPQGAAQRSSSVSSDPLGAAQGIAQPREGPTSTGPSVACAAQPSAPPDLTSSSSDVPLGIYRPASDVVGAAPASPLVGEGGTLGDKDLPPHPRVENLPLAQSRGGGSEFEAAPPGPQEDAGASEAGTQACPQDAGVGAVALDTPLAPPLGDAHIAQLAQSVAAPTPSSAEGGTGAPAPPLSQAALASTSGPPSPAQPAAGTTAAEAAAPSPKAASSSKETAQRSRRLRKKRRRRHTSSDSSSASEGSRSASAASSEDSSPDDSGPEDSSSETSSSSSQERRKRRKKRARKAKEARRRGDRREQRPRKRARRVTASPGTPASASAAAAPGRSGKPPLAGGTPSTPGSTGASSASHGGGSQSSSTMARGRALPSASDTRSRRMLASMLAQAEVELREDADGRVCVFIPPEVARKAAATEGLLTRMGWTQKMRAARAQHQQATSSSSRPAVLQATSRASASGAARTEQAPPGLAGQSASGGAPRGPRGRLEERAPETRSEVQQTPDSATNAGQEVSQASRPAPGASREGARSSRSQPHPQEGAAPRDPPVPSAGLEGHESDEVQLLGIASPPEPRRRRRPRPAPQPPAQGLGPVEVIHGTPSTSTAPSAPNSAGLPSASEQDSPLQLPEVPLPEAPPADPGVTAPALDVGPRPRAARDPQNSQADATEPEATRATSGFEPSPGSLATPGSSAAVQSEAEPLLALRTGAQVGGSSPASLADNDTSRSSGMPCPPELVGRGTLLSTLLGVASPPVHSAATSPPPSPRAPHLGAPTAAVAAESQTRSASDGSTAGAQEPSTSQQPEALRAVVDAAVQALLTASTDPTADVASLSASLSAIMVQALGAARATQEAPSRGIVQQRTPPTGTAAQVLDTPREGQAARGECSRDPQPQASQDAVEEGTPPPAVGEAGTAPAPSEGRGTPPVSPPPDPLDPDFVPDNIYSESDGAGADFRGAPSASSATGEQAPQPEGSASASARAESPPRQDVLAIPEDKPASGRASESARGSDELGRYALERLGQVSPAEPRQMRLAMLTANRWASEARLQSRLDAAWADNLREREPLPPPGFLITERDRRARDRHYGGQIPAALSAFRLALLETQRAEAATVARLGGTAPAYRLTPEDAAQQRNPLMRILAEAAPRQIMEDHLISPAALSGYFLSPEGWWTLVLGGDMYWNPSVRLGPPIANTRDLLRHKEIWFLLRCKTDMARIARRLCRPLATVRRSAQKYRWGELPPGFVNFHRSNIRANFPQIPPKMLCNAWPAPFVQHFWVWHEQYCREFPEVLHVTPGSREWQDFLTPYSTDFHLYIQPKYEDFLRTGVPEQIIIEESHIPRTGNVITDLERAIHRILPPFLQGRRPYNHLYHTVPMESAPGAARTWRQRIGLSLLPWGNEPRPHALLSMAAAVRDWPQQTRRSLAAPSSSDSEGPSPGTGTPQPARDPPAAQGPRRFRHPTPL